MGRRVKQKGDTLTKHTSLVPLKRFNSTCLTRSGVVFRAFEGPGRRGSESDIVASLGT
jgi:hypothetical protein